MFKLSKRETRLLQILIVIVSALILYFLIITPIVKLKSSISDEFENNQSRLQKLDKIYEEYHGIRQKKTQYESLLKQNRGITTLIEENEKNANILKNKSYTRDHPGKVQNNYKKISTYVRFEGVDIQSILKFIDAMENSGSLIKLSYIRINLALKERDAYDVTMKFESVTEK